MAKRGEEGIIRYTFGVNDLGARALLSPKTAGLTLVVIVIGLSTIFLASHRATASFKIGRSSLVTSRLTEGGHQLTFFSGSIASRRQTPQQFVLSVLNHAGEELEIKGSTRFDLAGNEKRDITLAVDSPIISGVNPSPITFRLVAEQDASIIEVAAYLTPAEPGSKTIPK